MDTKNPFTPKFPVLNGVNIYDPTLYAMSGAKTENDGIFERDVVGDISLARQYSVAGHSSTVEVGFKGWDARKTSLVDSEIFNGANGQPLSNFLSNYVDHNYYFGQYKYGPTSAFTKMAAALAPAGTSFDLVNNFQNTFDISERIWAGRRVAAIAADTLP